VNEINSLCHQLSAAKQIVVDQIERAQRLEGEIARLMNVHPGGPHYNHVDVVDFHVTAFRIGESPAQVFITERATGAACKDN
jgi:hypothetical protein